MITYPVDIYNTWWYAYDTSLPGIVRSKFRWPRADGGEITGLDPNIVLLREVTDPPPAYDPQTERVVPGDPVVDTAANTYTKTWVVEALSQEEIDFNNEREIAKAFYSALKNGTGTNLERLERVEKVAAHFLKVTYGVLN